MISICVYSNEQKDDIGAFLRKAFKSDCRKFDINNKESDLNDIENIYMKKGCFWCAVNTRKQIVGTIALRPVEDFFEVRRFFVDPNEKGKGIGQKLLSTCIDYAIANNICILKAATLERGKIVHYIFEKFGFSQCEKYSNSSADIFYSLNLDYSFIYKYRLSKLNDAFHNSLILNPTENVPMYSSEISADFFEGLYVSERFKDVNDKVIFAGRNEYIKFFEFVKSVWINKLSAYDIDLKSLAGLNAHLILFLCIIQKGDCIMILPEAAGGHFATGKILENIGAKIINMVPNIKGMCIDVEKTKILVRKEKPKFIFVDRSEGLNYEDFSWVSEFDFSYKIYDASQYLSQIITKEYKNPFDMGFNMIVSTLHKNYPGPQKGIIAVKNDDEIWNQYLLNAKTYISNTHPMAIAKSLMPLVNMEKFNEYSIINIECSQKLEHELIKLNVPVVKRSKSADSTLHIWILPPDKNASYEYYLKLEELRILTNYRLLPYELGYGLRIGTSAAVRCGLRPKHIKKLAEIMAEAYFDTLNNKLITKSHRLISSIVTGEL